MYQDIDWHYVGVKLILRMYNIHEIHQHKRMSYIVRKNLKNNPHESTLAPIFEYHKFMVLTYTIKHFVFTFASALEQNY